MSKLLLQRARDHVQSPKAFIQAVKYAYMSHFFANPLSLLLLQGREIANKKDVCEAIRHLPSFQLLAESRLQDGDADWVQIALEDNDFLLDEAMNSVNEGQQAMNKMFLAVEALENVRHLIPSLSSVTNSEMVLNTLSGQLLNGTFCREFLLAIKRMPSNVLSNILDASWPVLVEDEDSFQPFREELQALTKKTASNAKPLRTEFDEHNEKLTTTVVGHKVGLSKQQSRLSKEDANYSAFVTRLIEHMQHYFSQVFMNPQDLFMHEVFIYDLKSSIRDTLMPKPRFAIERALSAPSDYLPGDEEEVMTMPPPTALLYSLFLETGALANVYDLWSAFYTKIGGEDGKECDERQALALFYRSLAELRAFGMLKQSRRKTDHVAKMAWKGL